MLYFSGGTALNSYVDALCQTSSPITFVLPTSDDGGSTGEILRALGGPGLGDIHICVLVCLPQLCLTYMLVRLAERSGAEAEAVQRLLLYRLPSLRTDALSSWHSILSGDDALWKGITEPYKESIRAFLLQFNQEILRRAPKSFDWSGGSIGNFFFTGARLFFNSLEAAIFLFSRVARVPPHIQVLPALSSSGKVVLGALLHSGERIVGQNHISHPSTTVQVHKDTLVPLPSPIATIYYLTEEGQPMYHHAAEAVLGALASADVIVYAIGSLYTSIMPCLVLRGVGEKIAEHAGRKVLLLNAKPDRETLGLTASAYVKSITDGLNRLHSPFAMHHTARRYITDVVAVEGSVVHLDEGVLTQLGVSSHTLQGEQDSSLGCAVFSKRALASFVSSLRSSPSPIVQKYSAE